MSNRRYWNLYASLTGASASGTQHSDPTDIRYADTIGYMLSWAGSQASGTFTVTSSIAAGVTASIGAVGNFVSVTGANSGSSWNTGSSTASAASNLATAINTVSSSAYTALASGSVVTVTSVAATGSGSNVALSSSNTGVLVAAGLTGADYPSGSWKIEESFDYVPSGTSLRNGIPNTGSWDTIPNLSITGPNQSGSGHTIVNITGLAAPYVRATYTAAQGSGTVSAVFAGKGN